MNFTDIPIDFVYNCLTPYDKEKILQRYELIAKVDEIAATETKTFAFIYISDNYPISFSHLKNIYYEYKRKEKA